jgi:hypothetical protein
MVTTKSNICFKDDKIRGLIRTEYSEGTGSNETEYGKSEGSNGNIMLKFTNDDTKNGEGSKETLW